MFEKGEREEKKREIENERYIEKIHERNERERYREN